MPIFIEKGSDLLKNKHHNVIQQNTMIHDESLENIQSIKQHKTTKLRDIKDFATATHYLTSSEDMADVLHLKVFHQTEQDGKTNNPRLIGDKLFYNDDDNIIKVVNSSDKHPESQLQEHKAQPTLLQQLRSIKYQQNNKKNEQKSMKTFLSHINESNLEMKAIKAGKSIEVRTDPPTLEETLAWVCKYVESNERSVLLEELLSIEEEVQQYRKL